jgi:hypothetical protein
MTLPTWDAVVLLSTAGNQALVASGKPFSCRALPALVADTGFASALPELLAIG